MPQINALDLAMTPKSLADINNVKVDYLPDVWKWQQNASQRDQTTLADMMRAAAEEEAMGPGRLQKQQADLQSTLLGNQEKQQDIRTKTRDNDFNDYLLPQKKITEWKKLIGDASDTDFKMAENEVYTMLRSQDPKVRAIGKQLEGGLKEAVKARLVGDQQVRVQNIKEAGDTSRNNATIAAANERESLAREAGKYKKKTEDEAKGIISAVQAGKLTYEKAATSFEILSRVEEDPTKAAMYADLASKFGAEALKQTQARQGGGVDIGAKGIPTIPQTQTGLGSPTQNKPDPLGIR
jgi:hypothetical protein